MLTDNFSSSTQLAKSEELSLSEGKSVAFKSLIQYFVSDASFNAMLIFETKSDLLCACSASATFAPMLVPLRSNCFERIFSFFPSVRYLYRLTIRIAKSKLLLSIVNFFVGGGEGSRTPVRKNLYTTFSERSPLLKFPARVISGQTVRVGSFISHGQPQSLSRLTFTAE